MDVTVYKTEAELRQGHWWYEGRNKLFTSLLQQQKLQPRAFVLDVGTGTGGNLEILKRLNVLGIGLDPEPLSLAACVERKLGPLVRATIYDLPFASNSFDLVLATDVIEHVDDDSAALCEIARILKPGGRALITVPAFQSLWGAHDEISFHKRRYRLGPLIELIRAARLHPIQSFYFNFVLFLPIWVVRKLVALAGRKPASDTTLNTRPLNAVLNCIFWADVRIAPWLRPPFGVSALVVAEKKS